MGTSIWKNIKKLREENGRSRTSMAAELGYSVAQYGKIERGEQRLDCRGLLALCRFAHCRPEQIVFGKKMTGDEPAPDYFLDYSEEQKRRLFRSLYILLECHKLEAQPSFHKLFGTDLLREIPVSETNIIPQVLEYERKSRDLTRREMIQFLGISKNKYYSLLDGEELSSISCLIQLTQNLGYDMTFLLTNRIRPALFLSGLSRSWNEQEREIFQRQMDMFDSMEKLSEQWMEGQGSVMQEERVFLK